MKMLRVNCRTCPGKRSTYKGLEMGLSFACYFDYDEPGFIGQYRGHIGFGAAYSLPEEPPDFCPLEDAPNNKDQVKK